MKQLLTTIAALVLVGCGSSMLIHKAAGDGNIEAVKQYLDGGADVNATYGGGRTPLHQAAWKGHKEIAELLIANGADVDTLGAIEFLRNAKYGSTTKGAKSAWSTHHDYTVSSPLLEAAAKGHKEIVNYSLQTKPTSTLQI